MWVCRLSYEKTENKATSFKAATISFDCSDHVFISNEISRNGEKGLIREPKTIGYGLHFVGKKI